MKDKEVSRFVACFYADHQIGSNHERSLSLLRKRDQRLRYRQLDGHPYDCIISKGRLFIQCADLP